MLKAIADRWSRFVTPNVWEIVVRNYLKKTAAVRRYGQNVDA